VTRRRGSKPSRNQHMASQSAYGMGFKAGAVIDGKGWAERVNALVDVIVATQGRTFTLETIDYVLE